MVPNAYPLRIDSTTLTTTTVTDTSRLVRR